MRNTRTTNPKNLLGTAIAIASEVHEFQFDMGGNPYILHPLRVMNLVGPRDHELMQIAVMHDVVEDSDGLYTIATLANAGFSVRVIDALGLLTHVKNHELDEDEDYQNYIRKIATNEDAIKVKMADLRDNSDITRLKGLREKDFKRMQRYNKAFVYLTQTAENLRMVGYGH